MDKESKFKFNLVEVAHNIRLGNLSIFSGVVDTALKERISELRIASKKANAGDKVFLREMQDEILLLDSYFYEKSFDNLIKKIYPEQMIRDRISEFDELIDTCKKQIYYGQFDAMKSKLKEESNFDKF